MMKAFLFLCLFILSNSIFASMLKISPLRIDLTLKESIAILEITNVDKEDVLVQAEVLRWTQKEGVDQYHPTKDILIIPPMFKLKPQQIQIIRVALRNNMNVNNEMSYRLFFTDVIQRSLPFNGQGQAIQMKMRIGLPIFITPDNIINTFELRAKLINNKKILLTLYNTGNIHLFIDEIQLFEGSHSISSPIKTFNYILPQQKFAWEIALNARPRSRQINIILDDHGNKIKKNATLLLT